MQTGASQHPGKSIKTRRKKAFYTGTVLHFHEHCPPLLCLRQLHKKLSCVRCTICMNNGTRSRMAPHHAASLLSINFAEI